MSATDQLRYPSVSAGSSAISVVLSHRIWLRHTETIATEKRS